MKSARGHITITDLNDVVGYVVKTSIDEVKILSGMTHATLYVSIDVYKTVGNVETGYPAYIWIFSRKGNEYRLIHSEETAKTTLNYAMRDSQEATYLTAGYDAVVVIATDERVNPCTSMTLGTNYLAKKEIGIHKDGENTVFYMMAFTDASYMKYDPNASSNNFRGNIVGHCTRKERETIVDYPITTADTFKINLSSGDVFATNDLEEYAAIRARGLKAQMVDFGDDGTFELSFYLSEQDYEDFGSPTSAQIYFRSADGWEQDYTIPFTIIGKDGKGGETGKTGKMFYPAGDYSDSVTYTSDDYTCPLVHIVNNTTDQWWWLDAPTNVVDGHKISPETPNQEIWKQAFTKFEVVFTQALFTEFARLGSAVISGDWMISQHGTYDGREVEAGDTYTEGGVTKPYYTKFNANDPLGANGGFVPSYALDMKTGKIYMNDALVNGTVKAKNFFHNVCFFREGGVYSTKYYIVIDRSKLQDDQYDFRNKFSDGEVVTATELRNRMLVDDGHGNLEPYFNEENEAFRHTTHDADVIMCWPTPRNWQSTTPVYIPHPSEYEGKILMFSGFSYGANPPEHDVVIRCCTGEEVFSNAAYMDGESVIFSNRGEKLAFSPGGTLRLLSVKSSAGTYSWVIIENATGGDIYIDGTSYGGNISGIKLNGVIKTPTNEIVDLGLLVSQVKFENISSQDSYSPSPTGVLTLPVYPAKTSFGTEGTDYVPLTIGGTTKNVLTSHQSLSGYLPLSAGDGKNLTGTLYTQDILPKATATSTTGYNLGSSDKRWGSVYAQWGKFSGGVTVLKNGVEKAVVTEDVLSGYALSSAIPDVYDKALKLSVGNNTSTIFTANASSEKTLTIAAGSNVGLALDNSKLTISATDTWNAATTSQAGYVPKLETSQNTINSQTSCFVLTYNAAQGGGSTPTWMKLPVNAFKDTTYDLSGYLPLAGGTLTGALNVGENNNNKKKNLTVNGVTYSLDGMFPTTNKGASLGQTDLKWNEVHADKGYFSSSLSVNGIAVSLEGHTHSYIPLSGSLYITGSLKPNSDDQYNLGASNYRWKNIFGVVLDGQKVNLSNKIYSTTYKVEMTVDDDGLVVSPISPTGQDNALYVNGNLQIGADSDNYTLSVNGENISDLAFISKGNGTAKFLREDGTWQTFSATKLQNAHTIWGQSFDGSANVSGLISNVSGIKLNQTGTGHAWIDFHYGSSSTYTSNIYEPASGRLAINSVLNVIKDGNVGISTASPIEKLDVNGKIISGSIRIWGEQVSNDTKGLFIQASDKTNRAYITWNGNVETTDYLNIHTGWGNIALTPARNVGIGTTSPSYKLHVNGTFYASGDSSIGGTLLVGGNTVWHAGNDGSGSGLDADLLDGKHASDFLSLSGGTVTGNIQFKASHSLKSTTNGVGSTQYPTTFCILD